MAAAFSRLQLAAALLEYDNDPSDPNAPQRSAHDSAIFAHLRRNTGIRPQATASRRSDYLGTVPTETGTTGKRESVIDGRRSMASRGSIDALRNPFGADDNLDEEYEGEKEDLEVDLASWGLDAFMPKDKASRGAKGKGKATVPPNRPPVSSVRSHQPYTNDTSSLAHRRPGSSRSLSVGGNLDHFGAGNAAETNTLADISENRRRSIASPLELSNVESPGQSMRRRRASSHTPSQPLPLGPAHQSIPFPTESVHSASSNDNPRDHMHERTYSMASKDSRVRLKQDEPLDRPRALSNATMGTVQLLEDNPFALRPPSRSSKFDPKAAVHARTVSNASMGSRMLLDNDGVSQLAPGQEHHREPRYSTTLDLLRPKVLVMPSPLQPTTPGPIVQVDNYRAGFQLSRDGPPLPPGARSARRSSISMSVVDTSASTPIASNSFTPNPLMNLSLSQLTFRNTLMVGGTASDIPNNFPRATQEGEQVLLEPPMPIPEELQAPVPSLVDDFSKTRRPAGKLFGKSLIDDLESRKAEMRNKQRVFTGDQRPSMMARGQQQPLLDPSSIQARPGTERVSSYGSQGAQQAIGRRNSGNIKPLLNFDGDAKVPQPGLSPNPRLPNNRSVFGVDTLWEREMIKLKEIEAFEKIEAEENRKVEEQNGKKKGKKSKKKDSRNAAATELGNMGATTPVTEAATEPRVSTEPPLLPAIQPAGRKPPASADGSASEESETDDPSPLLGRDTDPAAWYAESSDDEDSGPRRVTGTGPRYPIKSASRPSQYPNDDSDEDAPLAATVHKALQRSMQDDSDEEKPLSVLMQKTKSIHLSVDFDNLHEESRPTDDDDDQPLGLRVSRVGLSSQGGADDDDRPLALHPEQQRRTQYQMLAQQQQQQQQFMMQAQLQSNMFFNPPTMSGYFGPPMMPPMMMQQQPMMGPPSVNEEVKYGRVDKWRRDVAVEGEP